MADNLEGFRKEIDEIDEELWEALKRRFEVTDKVGRFKKEKGMPVFVPEREKAIVEKKCESNSDFSPEFVESLCGLLFAESKKRQEGLSG